MTPLRLFVLLVGPLPIIVVSLALSRWVKPEIHEQAQGNEVVIARVNAPAKASAAKRRFWIPSLRTVTDVTDACKKAAETIRARLGPNCHVIVRQPFVLGGDFSESVLDDWYVKTIGPAARSMAHAYFRVPPDQPITVLLFSGEHSYDRYARALYGDADISIYGYYKRGQRVLVMNAATGAGTIVHELTHALADFDCPQIPDWFNEGLASLHEQCQIRSDETGLVGLVNWRLLILQRAIREGRLRSLESLIAANDFRMHDVGTNYAQARYFCLWLQQLGNLESFFDHWRSGQAADPLGLKAVLAIFPGQTWEEIEQQFQAWVLTLSWEPATPISAAAAS